MMPELTPKLSVVVVVHDMARQAPRTLRALSAAYQRGIGADEYEVIVVDNGSDPPLDTSAFADLQGTFRLIRIDDAPPSPASAINRGLAAARGDVIGVMIDGARLATPGLAHFALHGARLHEHAVVATLGWHLGFDASQRLAMESGYDESREDRLLVGIDWPTDGYRLFEIGALDGSSIDGWFRPIGESNALFMRREMWDALHGVDERFDMPGGGFLNLDLLRRSLELPDAELVVLLGEGTFHQLHNGIATGASMDQLAVSLATWKAQYQEIRGRPWAAPSPRDRTYVGVLPRSALSHFARAATSPVFGDGPLGTEFDRDTWSLATPALPVSARDAELVKLAHREFREGRYAAAAAVSRLARGLAPDEPEPQRLLSLASAWLRGPASAADGPAEVHCALGDAYGLIGDRAAAVTEYRAALGLDGALVRAHLGLSTMLLPGDDYVTWLTRLHELLRPAVYLEVGVANGRTLALARPPTIAIGVDPVPSLVVPVTAETHMFAEPSDEFFAQEKLHTLLGDRPVGLAFIDGLHAFEQALRDFINLESCSGERSVIIFHDTLPLDETTQRRERVTQFWTGDIWKVVLCLRRYRPDLEIFTIATPPSGLTVVCNLDRGSSALRDGYDLAVGQYMNAPFSTIAAAMEADLSIVPNDWDLVVARLRARGLA